MSPQFICLFFRGHLPNTGRFIYLCRLVDYNIVSPLRQPQGFTGQVISNQIMLKKGIGIIISLLVLSLSVSAQDTKPKSNSPGPSTAPTDIKDNDSIIVTVILKHQQDKNLPEIRRILEAQGFWDLFPPAEARVISWTMAVGLGHVIIMKLPAHAIRKLHLAVGNGAFGAYTCEILLSYDYKGIWEEYMERREGAKEDRN